MEDNEAKEWLFSGNGNAIINAVAGAGKTKMLIRCIELLAENFLNVGENNITPDSPGNLYLEQPWSNSNSKFKYYIQLLERYSEISFNAYKVF